MNAPNTESPRRTTHALFHCVPRKTKTSRFPAAGARPVAPGRHSSDGLEQLEFLRLHGRRAAGQSECPVDGEKSEIVRLAIRRHRHGLVHHPSFSLRKFQGFAIHHGRQRPVHSRNLPLSFRRECRGIQASCRFHSFPLPEIRNPHLRGIPKQAVAKNLPIAGSAFHAADAADTSDSCPWNPDNFGLDPQNSAAQAYYDSIAQLYAGWGVDFLKGIA